MNTFGTDPWEIGPMVAAGTAVAIEPAQEPERRPPAEPEPEAEPDARCVDDAGSEVRANTAVDPWEIGPLPSASNPVGNDIPAGAPASEPQHVGGAVEPADLADTIDLTPVGEQDAAMPVREWRRMATTAGGILLAACVTVAGMSAWESHESATAARERENAADVLADLQAWWKTSQPDMRQHVDEMMAGIDAAMGQIDKRLYAAAEKEFKERSLDPDGECYQLDGGTFISQESFDGICGDQRDRYMAWKNQAEPARLVSAWDDPARLDRLVGDLIDADDGGGCFYTDAQPIDYTQGMDYSPQQLAADSGLGDTVPLACESNASYSLAHHPDIKFTATGSPDGRKALEVSVPGSARHALITAKPGAFDVSLHDERGIVSGESFPYEANDSWTYRLSGQALRGALDLAVGWADPQETSPETAGLDLALDDGMETTHGR